MRAIGADRSPYYITVYPNDSDQKTNSGNYISAWQKSGKGNIGYFDMSEMLLVNMRGILDLVSAMLIAVAAISLVVSTVMIGVITSNSVVERTREIGILRAIGARKKIYATSLLPKPRSSDLQADFSVYSSRMSCARSYLSSSRLSPA